MDAIITDIKTISIRINYVKENCVRQRLKTKIAVIQLAEKKQSLRKRVI